MDMDDYFLSRPARDCKNMPNHEPAPDSNSPATSLHDDMKFLETTYRLYKCLYRSNSWMPVVPMKSEGEVIRTLISGWSRERAIGVYKFLYLKELIALREGSGAEAPMHVFEFECFNNQPEPLMDPSASIDISEPSLADAIAAIDIGEIANSHAAYTQEEEDFDEGQAVENATELDLNRLMDFYGAPVRSRRPLPSSANNSSQLATRTEGISATEIIAAIESVRPSGETIPLSPAEWIPAIDSILKCPSLLQLGIETRDPVHVEPQPVANSSPYDGGRSTAFGCSLPGIDPSAEDEFRRMMGWVVCSPRNDRQNVP